MANFQRQNHCECLDFPVSWTFYRDHCRIVHGFDPGDNEPPPDCHRILEPVARPLPDINQRIDQLRGEMVRLRDRLGEHIKGKQKPKVKSESKGIEI